MTGTAWRAVEVGGFTSWVPAEKPSQHRKQWWWRPVGSCKRRRWGDCPKRWLSDQAEPTLHFERVLKRSSGPKWCESQGADGGRKRHDLPPICHRRCAPTSSLGSPRRR